jgi:hypothetical protein
VQTQLPFSQTCPPGTSHSMPQAPQLNGSLCTSTQELLQAIRPALHDASHWPMLHNEPAGHTTPQRPQLYASPCTSTQLPQLVKGARQSQAPATQSARSGHVEPQTPQFATSLARSTQTLPQSAVPPEQVTGRTQTLFTQS